MKRLNDETEGSRCIKDYKELGLDRPPSYEPLKPPAAPLFLFVRREQAQVKSVTLKITSDGKVGLRVKGETASVVNAATGSRIANDLDAGVTTGLRPRFTCWSFSPDGKKVTTGSGLFLRSGDGNGTNVGRVQVWDSATGGLLATYETGSVRGVAFSEDGKTVIYDAVPREIESP